MSGSMTSTRCVVGDCRELMRELPENSVDAIVTDPPYGLEFMGKEWDKLSDQPGYVERGRITDRPDSRVPYGRGGGVNSYQAGRPMQSWHESWAREAYRVLKPGGHLLAFGGSRTYHRLACAIEDAGFEIRDQLQWLYGSGFPKSLDVSKAMDKAAGAEREVVGVAAEFARDGSQRKTDGSHVAPGQNDYGDYGDRWSQPITAPATDLAQRWQGFGTALKPAHEPIVLARKPLIGTVSRNVAEYGTGALNIDGCRIEGTASNRGGGDVSNRATALEGGERIRTDYETHVLGRWPANVILGHAPECREVGVKRVKPGNGSGMASRGNGDTSMFGIGSVQNAPGYVDADGYETVTAWECAPDCAAALLDAQSGERKPGGRVRGTEQSDSTTHIYGDYTRRSHEPYRDAGGASRFFLNVKPDDEVWYICESDGIVSHIADLTSGCPECGATMVPYRVPIEGDEARFRYEAKASRAERNAGLDGMPERKSSDDGYGSIQQPILDRVAPRENWQPHKTANHHPTVKPIAVMRWLVRLITPTGGTVLDPFMGSGTTGIAAALEGFDFIGIEQDAEYLAIAERRIAYWRNVRESLTMQSTLL